MTLSLTEDFKTVEELRKSTDAILKQVRETGRPVAVTMDGKPAVVMLEASRYEWLVHCLSLSRMVNKAQEDIRAGRGRPLEDFLEELSREEKAPNHHRPRRGA